MLPRRVLGLAVFLVWASLAWGQANFGTIVGSVQDPSGAAIPNATLTVTNNATGIVRTTKTDAAGQYAVPGLNPGTYTVHASASGFTPKEADNIPISVQSRQLVNFTLALGAVTQSVQVTATQPLLETQSASVGGVVTSTQIVDLPLNGRRYSDLVYLEPGVMSFPPGEVGHQTPDMFSVNGNQDLENDFLLDGTDNNSGSENLQENSTQVVQPPPDAISEFRMQTRTYSAEFGDSAGAVINASIKSGTNQFHGDVWEFARNNVFDANTFFNKHNGVPIGHFSQNQFGGTLGGPILRNKSFFFGDFQGLISSQDTTVFSTVPTPLMKNQFNFSELPKSSLPLTPVVPSQTSCIIGGATIASTCVDPVAQKLFSLYPDPNVPSAVAKEGTPNSFTANNYKFVYPVPNHTYSTDVRIDQVISNADQIFGAYSFNQQTYVQTPPWTSNPDAGNGNFSANYLLRNQLVSLGWTHTFSASVVNQFHVGFNRGRAFSYPIGVTLGQSDAAKYGLTGIPSNPYVFGLPPLQISGFTTLGGSRFRPQWQISYVWQYTDSLSWIHGTHSFQFGWEYHRTDNNFLDINAPQGFIQTTGIYTGASFGAPDFLLGDVSTAGLTTPTLGHNYYPGSAYYFQDTWRATKNLTFNYGLRYEYFSPMLSHDNKLANFYPTNGGEVVPVAPNASGAFARSTIHPDFRNFGPRLGFAYHMFNQVVWRGGYGIFYQHRDRIGSESMLDLNPPFLFDATLSQQRGSTTPLFQLQNGFPISDFPEVVNLQTQQIRAQDPNERTPYVEQASFGPEIQLSQSTVLDITAVGNWARKMERLRNANQGKLLGFDPNNNNAPIIEFPYANLNSCTICEKGTGQHNYLELATYDGNSNYGGLELNLRREYRAGFSYGLDYTWSHSLADFVDNLSGAPTPQNAYDYAAEYSNSYFNVGQRFVGNVIWDLPIGRNKHFMSNANRVLNGFIGGWQVNSIVTLQSGLPFNVTLPPSQDTSFTGPSHMIRPDCVANPLIGANSNPEADLVDGSGVYMNPASFAIPAPGDFGTCRPRLLSGPGVKNVDFSLFKTITISEARRVEIRGEFFNFFNHPNFGFPVGTLGQASFGKITSTTTAPREIQLAAKFYF